MTCDNDNSGEYIPPKSTYLDDVPVYDAELGGIVPAWKALVYHGAKARHFAQMRNDSASGHITEEAQKGQPSDRPKLPPPLVADAVGKDKASKMKLQSALDALGRLETRLDQFEQRKAEEAECARRAEAALALVEKIAEEAPEAMFDALPPAPKQRLH